MESSARVVGSGTTYGYTVAPSRRYNSPVIALKLTPYLFASLMASGSRRRIWAELSRSALRAIGSDLMVTRGDFTFNALFGGQAGAPTSAILSTESFLLALDFISTNSYSKMLAEPNLVTLNGRPARLWEAYIDRAIADIERRSGLLRVLNPQRCIWLNEEDSQTLLPDVSRPYKRAIQLD